MAYSLDFREKILEAWLNQEGSYVKLAKRFKVSKGFIEGLVQLYRETGSVQKRPHGGGQPDKLAQHEGYQKLYQLYEEQNDLFDHEYQALLAERYGIEVSRQTVNRAFARLGITKKKDLSRERAAKRKRCGENT